MAQITATTLPNSVQPLRKARKKPNSAKIGAPMGYTRQPGGGFKRNSTLKRGGKN